MKQDIVNIFKERDMRLYFGCGKNHGKLSSPSSDRQLRRGCTLPRAARPRCPVRRASLLPCIARSRCPVRPASPLPRASRVSADVT